MQVAVNNVLLNKEVHHDYFYCTVLLQLKIQPHKLRKFTKVAANNFTGN